VRGWLWLPSGVRRALNKRLRTGTEEKKDECSEKQKKKQQKYRKKGKVVKKMEQKRK